MVHRLAQPSCRRTENSCSPGTPGTAPKVSDLVTPPMLAGDVSHLFLLFGGGSFKRQHAAVQKTGKNQIFQCMQFKEKKLTACILDANLSERQEELHVQMHCPHFFLSLKSSLGK